MRTALALCAALLLATPAMAQDEDWDLVQTPEGLTMATLDFGTNALAMRARAGRVELTCIITENFHHHGEFRPPGLPRRGGGSARRRLRSERPARCLTGPA